MKRITYTQLRGDLSTLLEAIRNGETIMVTQRGKPDVIIQRGIEEAKSVDNLLKAGEIKQEICSRLQNIETSELSPEFLAGMHKMVKKLEALVNSKEMRQISDKIVGTSEFLQNNSESFKKALMLTQEKYAHIIKALEDK